MASQQRIKRIYIEISNVCNLHCTFCNPTTRKKQVMSLTKFEYILTQVKPITSFIYLHVKGEPTLHPEFDQILSLCDNYEMNVQLVTNGTCLKNILPNHPSLRKLSISLHSLGQHTIDLTIIQEDILHLIKHQTIYCTYLEFRFWRAEQLDSRSQTMLDWFHQSFDLKQLKSQVNYQIQPNCYLGFESSFTWPSINDFKQVTGTCLGGVTMLAILADGLVTLCCLDNNGDLTIGNIFEQSLTQILQSPRYLNYLHALKQHQLIEPLCQSCTYRHRFK